jgi:hypothetical protein
MTGAHFPTPLLVRRLTEGKTAFILAWVFGWLGLFLILGLLESYISFSRLARGRKARRGLPISFAFLVRLRPFPFPRSPFPLLLTNTDPVPHPVLPLPLPQQPGLLRKVPRRTSLTGRAMETEVTWDETEALAGMGVQPEVSAVLGSAVEETLSCWRGDCRGCCAGGGTATGAAA